MLNNILHIFWGIILSLLFRIKNIIVLFFIIFLSCQAYGFIGTEEIKQKAIALYMTDNFKEAEKLLINLPLEEKSEDIYILLANIAQEKGDDNLAIKNLNKALDRNNKFDKAYYNLGCIFASKNSFELAKKNFELAIQYNKNLACAYYNLACCQLKEKKYKLAKKNLTKALELEPMNKDACYNLILCYKILNQPKQAKKLLEIYNKMN